MKKNLLDNIPEELLHMKQVSQVMNIKDLIALIWKLCLNSYTTGLPSPKEVLKSLFFVYTVNKTKIIGPYSRCSRHKVFYQDLFVEEK